MSTNPNKPRTSRQAQTNTRRAPVKTLRVIRRADVSSSIDADGTKKFEAFLDRNFPAWRQLAFPKARDARKNRREWWMGFDDMVRTAIYYGQYVEIIDGAFRGITDMDFVVTRLKSVICDINGDRTRVAVWE